MGGGGIDVGVETSFVSLRGGEYEGVLCSVT